MQGILGGNTRVTIHLEFIQGLNCVYYSFNLLYIKKNHISFSIALVMGPDVDIENVRETYLEKTKWLQVETG